MCIYIHRHIHIYIMLRFFKLLFLLTCSIIYLKKITYSLDNYSQNSERVFVFRVKDSRCTNFVSDTACKIILFQSTLIRVALYLKDLHFAFALSKIYLFKHSRINYNFAFEYVTLTQNFENFERRPIVLSRILQSKCKYFQIIHSSKLISFLQFWLQLISFGIL